MNNVMGYLKQRAKDSYDLTAVIEEDRSCTYGELYRRSLQVASALKKIGISKKPVIVMMDKGISALFAFFGIAYSGNHYCLINPDLPPSRARAIKDILSTPYVITDRKYYKQAKEWFWDSECLMVEDLIEDKADPALAEIAYEQTIDTDPLYINFTSGSTGVPKGVMIAHHSVIDFIDTFTDAFGIDKNERIGNQAPFDFDVSVKDIYSCLKTGATLVIIPKRYFSSPKELIDYLCDKEVTTLIWAVSALSLIYTFHGLDYRVPSKISKVMFSGEIMPLKHLKSWQKALPKAKFVNLYGPSEITCNCTYHVIDPDRDYSSAIPIGRPFSNNEVFLLDEDRCRIETVERIGEIAVRGRGLALGYYGNKEETQKHFIIDPGCDRYEERIYLTGDLGHFDQNGDLIFDGRKDFQIKYLGHRIELEEIEKQAMSLIGIEQFCCLFDSEKHRLYGFYVGSLSRNELVRELGQKLPEYMIPTKIIGLEMMPLSKNGKIDRRLLMEVAKGGKKDG